MTTTPGDYTIERILKRAPAEIAQVIALGDKNRRTLGFLPRAGYIEAATRQHIVLAKAPDGSLAGYCLFNPTRSYVRIVHVCVGDDHTGRGLAAGMIDAVSNLHAGLPGLRLKCRRDWVANKMWPKLGFQPRTDVRGRSSEGHLLTVWWRANKDQMDLFSVESRQSDVPLVGVDSNIFSDLHSRKPDRKGRFSGTVALLAGDQQIELALPNSVPNELNQTTDDSERRRLLDCTASYRRLTASEDLIRSAQIHLLAPVKSAETSKDPSLTADARLIAEAALGGADLYVTRDVNAVRQLGDQALELYNLPVIEPTELAAFLHRREFDSEYQPARLLETQYQVVRGDYAIWASEQTQALLNTADGERRADFASRLRAIADQSTADIERNLILAPDGTIVAAWATRRVDDAVLEVPLLRVARSSLASTLARQLLFLFRQAATKHSTTTIEVTDPYPSPVAARSMEAEGYAQKQMARWTATSLNMCGNWDDIRSAAHRTRAVDVPGFSVPHPQQAAELERLWWPAKIADADIPSYVVSIRSQFAYDLLGHVATLVERPTSLGLSRENVYYRSARTTQIAPGRILWYSSGTEMSIVACSRLVERGTGTPTSLHQQFKRLGVWDLQTIRSAADSMNRVGYLRFADTELFEHPISLTDIRKLSAGHAKLPSQQPTKISGELFTMLYQKGRGLDHPR